MTGNAAAAGFRSHALVPGAIKRLVSGKPVQASKLPRNVAVFRLFASAHLG